MRTADHLTPGHWPVVSSIFVLTTRKPFVSSAVANTAAVICGTKGGALRAFFIFNTLSVEAKAKSAAWWSPHSTLEGRPRVRRAGATEAKTGPE